MQRAENKTANTKYKEEMKNLSSLDSLYFLATLSTKKILAGNPVSEFARLSRNASFISLFYETAYRICPYCETQLIKSEYPRSPIDHIRPKARFPKLALSNYNLIVCCNACNTNKGNRTCISPLENDFSWLQILLDKKDDGSIKSIMFVAANKATKHHLTTLKLTSVYNSQAILGDINYKIKLLKSTFQSGEDISQHIKGRRYETILKKYFGI